jgi:hypothetical protein
VRANPCSKYVPTFRDRISRPHVVVRHGFATIFGWWTRAGVEPARTNNMLQSIARLNLTLKSAGAKPHADVGTMKALNKCLGDRNYIYSGFVFDLPEAKVKKT